MPARKVEKDIFWKSIRSRASYSKRINYVRSLLEIPDQEKIIKLSGGFPDETTFPTRKLFLELVNKAQRRYGDLFQYEATTGFKPLREIATRFLADRGIAASSDRIQIVTGSQQLLYLAGDALIDPGDRIIVEAPTYLGALKAFDRFNPDFIQVETDPRGIVIDSLVAAIEKSIRSGKKPKLLYLVPNFSNPTGITMSLSRRKRIADVIKAFNIPLLEDDPYREMRYRGEHLPSIYSMAPEHVIYATTVSKTFAPAMRVGIAVAPPEFLVLTAELKQGIDLNTSKLLQALTAVYIADGYLQKHLPRLVKLYKPRMEAMLAALEEHFTNRKGYSWTKPDGGMFTWMTGPKHINTEKLLPAALKAGVAYVPGVSCFADPSDGFNTIRLNFSHQPPGRIREGIRRLAEIFP